MADPKNTAVSVTYEGIDPANGKAIFDIQPTGPNPLPTGPDGLIFINDNFPGFKINFVLTDKTNQNYAFPPDSNKKMAVSSELGANLCPAQGISNVFHVVGVGGSNNDTLTVLNPNQQPVLGQFSYVLWITNDGGATYVPLDPGGVNQNGSTRGFSMANLAVIVALVALAALVVLYFLGAFTH